VLGCDDVQGLGLLSVSSRLYLIRPGGCGVDHAPCGPLSGRDGNGSGSGRVDEKSDPKKNMFG
jgi:hypothetical protein